jgi:hypothetical protein
MVVHRPVETAPFFGNIGCPGVQTDPTTEKQGVEIFHSVNYTTFAMQKTTFCPAAHHEKLA